MNRIKRVYREKAIESMMEDWIKWERQVNLCWDGSWAQYVSPSYGNIRYKFDDDVFGLISLSVYVNDVFEFTLYSINPFSRLARAKRRLRHNLKRMEQAKKTLYLASALYKK